MIERYTKEIEKLLEKIKQEDEENTNDLITYATSTEYNVGGTLCRYGELYKLVFYSKTYDEVIHKLENLYNLARFETYEDDIKKIQNMFIKGIKKGEPFEIGTQLEVLEMLEHEYILDTILKCL